MGASKRRNAARGLIAEILLPCIYGLLLRPVISRLPGIHSSVQSLGHTYLRPLGSFTASWPLGSLLLTILLSFPRCVGSQTDVTAKISLHSLHHCLDPTYRLGTLSLLHGLSDSILLILSFLRQGQSRIDLACNPGLSLAESMAVVFLILILAMWILPDPHGWTDPVRHFTPLVAVALQVSGYGIVSAIGEYCGSIRCNVLLIAVAIQLLARVATERWYTGRIRLFGTGWEEDTAFVRATVVEDVGTEVHCSQGRSQSAEVYVPPEQYDPKATEAGQSLEEGDGDLSTEVDSNMEEEHRRRNEPWRTILHEARENRERKRVRKSVRFQPVDRSRPPEGTPSPGDSHTEVDEPTSGDIDGGMYQVPGDFAQETFENEKII